MPNSGSIYNKLLNATKTSSFKNKNKAAIEGATREEAEKAGDLLVNCIENAIKSSGLSGAVIAAIGGVSRSPAAESGSSDHIRYTITIDVDKQSRPSLYPVGKNAGGAYDMAGLYDHGFDLSHAVWGDWHGHLTFGKYHSPATHFVQEGVQDFNSSYGGQFNAEARVTSGRFS